MRNLRHAAVALVAAAAALVTAASPALASPSTTYDARGHRLGAPSPSATSYPYRNQTNAQAVDDHGFTERQCVGFAGWWLYGHGVPFGYHTRGSQGVGTFGDGRTWDAGARAAGFPVSSRAKVGAVAQWRANETMRWTEHRSDGSTWTYTYGAGSAGHVAIVSKVYSDGFVDVTGYNNGGDRKLHVDRHIKAPRFLYIGV